MKRYLVTQWNEAGKYHYHGGQYQRLFKLESAANKYCNKLYALGVPLVVRTIY